MPKTTAYSRPNTGTCNPGCVGRHINYKGVATEEIILENRNEMCTIPIEDFIVSFLIIEDEYLT